jgi:hypothetical protein
MPRPTSLSTSRSRSVIPVISRGLRPDRDWPGNCPIRRRVTPGAIMASPAATTRIAVRTSSHADVHHDHVHVTELTGLLREGPDGDQLKGWPKTMRVFARRERPPGAKLSLFETADAWPWAEAITTAWQRIQAILQAP